MPVRIDYWRTAPEAMRAVFNVERYVRSSGLEHGLIHLVKLRASYMNGCAFCVDMHAKDARAAGETEQRVYAVPVWKETPFFTPRERAALEWTELVTRLGRDGVPDAAFEAVREHFSEKELVDLTVAIATINVWNRIAVSLGADVGSHTVATAPR